MPQPPQLAGSFCTFTSQPSTGFTLQFANGMKQETVHWPAMHCPIAFGAGGHWAIVAQLHGSSSMKPSKSSSIPLPHTSGLGVQPAVVVVVLVVVEVVVVGAGSGAQRRLVDLTVSACEPN